MTIGKVIESKLNCQPLLPSYHPKPDQHLKVGYHPKPDLKDVNFGHNTPIFNSYGFNFKSKSIDHKVVGRKLDKQM